MGSNSLSEQKLQQALNKLKKERFYWLVDQYSDLYLLDTNTFLIWQAQPDFNKPMNVYAAKIYLSSKKWLGKERWRLGSKSELLSFISGVKNPLRLGSGYKILYRLNWLSDDGIVNLDNNNRYARFDVSFADFIAANSAYQHKGEGLILDCLRQGWKLISVAGHIHIHESFHQAYLDSMSYPNFGALDQLLAQTPSVLAPLQTPSSQPNSALKPLIEKEQWQLDADRRREKERAAAAEKLSKLKAELIKAEEEKAKAREVELKRQKAEEAEKRRKLEAELKKLEDEKRRQQEQARKEKEAEQQKQAAEQEKLNNHRYIDSLRSPLPELDPVELTDPNKGLWELWGKSESELKELGIRARDPAQDVQLWPVAIDFGTSSTVVAYRQGGKKRLLRIGVKDFYAPLDPAHFENPTLLELVDFQALLKPWQETAYRPAVRWGDVRSSHEALANLRDNEGETAVTASMITKLKHWALRQSDDAPVILMDRTHRQEIRLPALTLRNPVKGQPLGVSTEDPFDPIELYAFFLGLAINWRKQGIYLRYYMTFPVAYPQSVKDKILASFRRGLQRSLPAPLIEQEAFNQFTVEERASEPAAFAAAALPFYDLEPTPEGLTYAVFDFGGGTTDFDYGIYREPTSEEEADGYETVFEHFGASGDVYLGGENLLENLAYRVFEANQSLLREKRIAITCPLDAEPFPGSEMLLDRTQAAVTNTQMLISRLRPFWEENKQNSQGIEKIKLLNRAGEEVVAELVMPYEDLSAYLQQRLEEGVDKFFTAMRKAFAEHEHQPEEVHVFLAGNASRSRYLQDALEKLLNDDSRMPASVIELYEPIDQQAEAPFQPTAKTGVALGLLDLCPGSRTLVINHAQQKAGGEAPFAYYVGRIRRGKFQPVLKRHASYGQWQEVGVVIDGHFELVYSLSPLANEGRLTEDSSELSYIPLSLYQADRQRLFVQAITPDQVVICTAENREALETHEASRQALDNMQTIMLK